MTRSKPKPAAPDWLGLAGETFVARFVYVGPQQADWIVLEDGKWPIAAMLALATGAEVRLKGERYRVLRTTWDDDAMRVVYELWQP